MPNGSPRFTSFVAAAALVVGAAACTDGDSDDAGSGTEGQPVVVHVHGLGINPADDELYAATHSGLFRLPEDGRAELVGDGRQDTMGFTVAGPDRFLASGHPAPGDGDLVAEGKPPLLGLIESTDAGETWTARSLLGEADFHGLAYAHDRAYGWNSSTGAFMVSEDLRTWRTLATVALFSFAVDPGDADHVVGTGPEGLTISDDGGATWTASSGPPLVILSWDADGDLWGVEAGGVVHRSGDGSEWEEVGQAPGQPQALVAADDVLHVAVQDDEGQTAMHVSDDGARSWSLRYRDPEQ